MEMVSPSKLSATDKTARSTTLQKLAKRTQHAREDTNLAGGRDSVRVGYLIEGHDGDGLALKVVCELPPQPHVRPLPVELVAKEPALQWSGSRLD